MSDWVILEYGSGSVLNAVWGPVHDVTSANRQADKLREEIPSFGHVEICPIRPIKEMLK